MESGIFQSVGSKYWFSEALGECRLMPHLDKGKIRIPVATAKIWGVSLGKYHAWPLKSSACEGNKYLLCL